VGLKQKHPLELAPVRVCGSGGREETVLVWWDDPYPVIQQAMSYVFEGIERLVGHELVEATKDAVDQALAWGKELAAARHRAVKQPERLEVLLLDCRIGNVVVRDQIMWDVHNFEADPEQICRQLCDEHGLEGWVAGPLAMRLRAELLAVWRLHSGEAKPPEFVKEAGLGERARFSGGKRVQPPPEGPTLRHIGDLDAWEGASRVLDDAQLVEEKERERREKEEWELEVKRLQEEKREEERKAKQRLAQQRKEERKRQKRREEAERRRAEQSMQQMEADVLGAGLPLPIKASAGILPDFGLGPISSISGHSALPQAPLAMAQLRGSPQWGAVGVQPPIPAALQPGFSPSVLMAQHQMLSVTRPNLTPQLGLGGLPSAGAYGQQMLGSIPGGLVHPRPAGEQPLQPPTALPEQLGQPFAQGNVLMQPFTSGPQ